MLGYEWALLLFIKCIAYMINDQLGLRATEYVITSYRLTSIALSLYSLCPILTHSQTQLVSSLQLL